MTVGVHICRQICQSIRSSFTSGRLRMRCSQSCSLRFGGQRKKRIFSWATFAMCSREFSGYCGQLERAGSRNDGAANTSTDQRTLIITARCFGTVLIRRGRSRVVASTHARRCGRSAGSHRDLVCSTSSGRVGRRVDVHLRSSRFWVSWHLVRLALVGRELCELELTALELRDALSRASRCHSRSVRLLSSEAVGSHGRSVS